MDTTLVTVTVLSMGMAAALSVIVWRLLRDEKDRSEARIAALTELSRVPSPESRVPVRESRVTRPLSRVQSPAAAPRFVDLELRTENREPEPLNLEPQTANLFVEHRPASPWSTRFAVMGGLGLAVASVILFALAAGSGKVEAKKAKAPATTAVQQASNEAGLELLSLRDSRQGGLTITGLVHNPQSGALLSRVTVTAYTVDDKGAFIASGRALLDVTALAPGDDSPFVVTVPVTETVARYRIGFRAEDGRVIAHVDKRTQGI